LRIFSGRSIVLAAPNDQGAALRKTNAFERPDMEQATTQSLMKPIPAEVLEIFGDAPILSTEDSDRYHAMIAAFAEHVDPGDFITWCYIKDLADCRTEIWRYRRMKAQAVENAHSAVINKRLDALRSAFALAPVEIRTRLVKAANEESQRRGLYGEEHKKHIEESEPRIGAEIKEVQADLQKSIDYWNAHRPSESELAGELHVWIGQHKMLDQQISLAEEKYAAAVEELERHLFGFGKALRGDLHKIIEGEIVTPGAYDASAGRRRLVCENDP
jgi:hypothetical protein